jgi:general stress protein 26
MKSSSPVIGPDPDFADLLTESSCKSETGRNRLARDASVAASGELHPGAATANIALRGETMNSELRRRITRIMQENRYHAFLATCDGLQPWLRPMSPFVEDDMTIWLVTAYGSRKVKQIEENPRVCLSFYRAPYAGSAVTVIGEAKVVEDLKAKRMVWRLGANGLPRFFPGGPESPEVCLLKILSHRIEWWDETGSGALNLTPDR